MLLGKKNLNKKKAIHDDHIPVKTLKENANFFAEYICIFYNTAITNVTPIFTKGRKNKKENFRPISILPVFLS